MKLLLENGAGPDFEDEGGQTPLSRAVAGGSVAVVQLLLAEEVKMDYKYDIVSLIRASIPVYRSIANTVTEFLTVAESK